MPAASMGCNKPWSYHGGFRLITQVFKYFCVWGLLVALGYEDDLLAASMGSQEPWTIRGCVTLSSQVLEYISVWSAVGQPRPRG
jgi:hypothetical protein